MIPHRLHQLWVGGPMPDHLAAYTETWRTHHPHWEFDFWHEGNLPTLRNQKLYDDAERIAPDNVGQLRSDIARYELLSMYGGLWADVDLECHRPIDELLDVSAFAAWEVEGRWVGNTILGATAGHPVLDALIRGLPENVRRKAGCRPNRLSGPQFLTPIALRHQVTVLPKDLFYGYLYSDIGTDREGFVPDGAFCSHHWNNRRRELARADR